MKYFNNIKSITNKIFGFLTVVVLIFTLVDYLLKWKIYYSLLSLIKTLWYLFIQNVFEISIVLFLIIILLLFLRLRENISNLKNTELEERIKKVEENISNLKNTELEERIKKVEENINTKIIDSKLYFEKKITSSTDPLDRRLFSVEETIVDIEIDQHKEKNQIGAMAMLIKKLSMNNKKGYGVENTLFEIKEYIKDRGMPSLYLSDLVNGIESCPKDLNILKNEILKLAQENMYKVGN